MRDYEAWTLSLYNRATRALIRRRLGMGLALAVVTAGGFLLAIGQRIPALLPNTHAAQWLTISWILPAPMLLISALAFYTWLRPGMLTVSPSPSRRKDFLVVFNVASLGKSVETVCHTIDSVLYWTAQHPEVCFETKVWVQLERSGYDANWARYDSYKPQGVEVHYTPDNYRTSRGTTQKARALQFALEMRRALFYDTTRMWVYHQDEETAIGEDVVLGIDQFIRAHADERAIGFGIILYDQHFDARPSQIQELVRTEGDVRNLWSMTSKYNPLGAFHGSHFLVRADVENEVGWDIGPDCLAEDHLFELHARTLGAKFYVMGGFAHEQAPLSIHDQLKQRKRWCRGLYSAWKHERMTMGRRISISYSLVAWMSAILCVPAMLFAILAGFGSLVPLFGLLTGFIWCAMVLVYYKAWVLHSPYVVRPPVWKMVVGGVIGSYFDGIAPWLALAPSHSKVFEVIAKDVPP